MLLQQGKGGDMASAFGGGGSQTAFGARAGATVLTKATAILGVLFMLGAIVLGIMGAAAVRFADARPRRRRRQQQLQRRRRRPGAGDSGASRQAPTPGKPGDRRSRRAGPEVTRQTTLPRESGGIGRRTSLRGWRSQDRGGSSPPFRTSLRS